MHDLLEVYFTTHHTLSSRPCDLHEVRGLNSPDQSSGRVGKSAADESHTIADFPGNSHDMHVNVIQEAQESVVHRVQFPSPPLLGVWGAPELRYLQSRFVSI